ncbi:MAG: NADH-quinone oxidoreductase subunit L [Thermodesulfobacteriota bacterium]
MKILLSLLLFLPLAGAVFNALLGRILPRRVVETVACVAILGSLAAAVAVFARAWQSTYYYLLLPWVQTGSFAANLSLYYNPVAALMTLMVTFVAGLIHLYSAAFMREDRDYVRYFCYLNLFVFAMLVIVLADDLLFVFLGWEGVGFCSYALIGFWYDNPANASAGSKALIVTRIGDVGFGIAVALSFFLFHSLSLTIINARAASISPGMITILSLLLLWAAVGKSAQLPLTVWLPDAMAGPTPVSALIHAATMVTAGVLLLVRLIPVVSLSPPALLIIAGVGALTTLYGACAALAQRDIKRVLAYSTLSQVGYMILAVGAVDIIGGMFHLLSHAFFKSLLFLGAGCVIQALHEEHDIFRMGNLRRLLPGVYWPFLLGALCLSAFPMIGGFFSKDRILLATYLQPGLSYKIFWLLGLVAAFLTPIYTMRMTFLAFQERAAGPAQEDLKPFPRLMTWVLWPLAILAVGDGFLNIPGGPGKDFLSRFLAVVPGSRPDLGASAALEWTMGLGSGIIILAMLALAYHLYGRPDKARAWPGGEGVLGSGFYLDHVYQKVLVAPYQALARVLWLDVDEGGLDRSFGGLAAGLLALSGGLGRWTTGRLSTYLAMLFVGLTLLVSALAVSWYLW